MPIFRTMPFRDTLTPADLDRWVCARASRPGHEAATSLLANQPLDQALYSAPEPIDVFNTRISREVGPVTCQPHNDNAWIYAMLNVARLNVAKSLRIKGDLELSQMALVAAHAIEQGNHARERMIEYAEEPLDSPVCAFAMRTAGPGDGNCAHCSLLGGTNDCAGRCAVNLISKYGVVPHGAFKASRTGAQSHTLVRQLLASYVRAVPRRGC
jgi:aminopeptidase C